MGLSKEHRAFFLGVVIAFLGLFAWGKLSSSDRSQETAPSAFEEAVELRKKAHAVYRETGRDGSRHCEIRTNPPCTEPPAEGLELAKIAVAEGPFLTDFKKLIIYYSGYYVQVPKEFEGLSAGILKFENFNQLLVESVQKNFEGCLESPLVLSQSLISIAPQNLGYKPSKEGILENNDVLLREVYDPENLTIILSLGYRVRPETVDTKETKKVEVEGSAYYNLYRPMLPARDALNAISEYRGTANFNTLDEGKIKAKLEKFFARLKSRKCDVIRAWRNQVKHKGPRATTFMQ